MTWIELEEFWKWLVCLMGSFYNLCWTEVDTSLKIIIQISFRSLSGRYITTQHKNIIEKKNYWTIKISNYSIHLNNTNYLKHQCIGCNKNHFWKNIYQSKENRFKNMSVFSMSHIFYFSFFASFHFYFYFYLFIYLFLHFCIFAFLHFCIFLFLFFIHPHFSSIVDFGVVGDFEHQQSSYWYSGT